MKHKLFTFLLAIVAGTSIAISANFSVDGIYYNIESTNAPRSVSVTYFKQYGANKTYISGDVIIPDSVYYYGNYYRVIKIGNSAFYACDKMTSITLPPSITSIEDYAFYGCSGLKYIDYNVSSNCNVGTYNYTFALTVDSIEELRIGKNVNIFPFEHRPMRIKRIVVDEDNPYFSCYDSVLFNKDMTELICYPSLKEDISYTIPNGVQYINNWAFYLCNNLQSINVPNGLVEWRYNISQVQVHDGFSGNNLTTIYWNSEDIFYDNSASWPLFSNNTKTIKNVILGDTLKKIPNGILNGLHLPLFIIPETIDSIGTLGGFIDTLEYRAINATFYSSLPLINSYNAKVVNIGDKVKTIPDGFCWNIKSAITIPCTVDSIGSNAFNGSNVMFRDCGKTIYNPKAIITLCSGLDIQNLPEWVRDTITALKTIDSLESYEGEYIQYSHNNTFDSVINTFLVITGRIDSIQLPDTILCHRGAEMCDNKGHCQVFESSGVFTGTYENIYGCDSIVFRNVIVIQDTTYLPDTLICAGESIFDGKEPQSFYESGVYNYTYINCEGCDSVITRNVIVSKAVAPKIIATPEQDTFNSGTIRIYNKYCTGSEYYDNQYNYIYKNAEYDYFTINGTKYDFSSAIEGEYNEYYHPDGIRVIDEPSTVIDNLHGGNYHIVFYSACDSVEKYIEIQQYGIEVNGMYYLLNENNHTATLTYRGASYDDYSSEYSGNITITKTITFDENEYQVIGINSYAFSGCNNITSITMESETPISMYSSGLSSNCIIYVPYGSLNAYKSANGWRNYTIHVINPSHATVTTGATSATITLGNTNEAQHIASCGMEGGAEEFAGNVIEYIGLEPNSEYANIPLFIKTKEGDLDNTTVSFTTTALELTTKASKPVSSTTAILLAETNMADAEVSCGFEYKRNDAPDDMAGTKVFCPVANGQMAGRLKNLKDDVYYKYRAFYQSAAGKMYYGDWQYIFTGDVAVAFDPVIYTYAASAVTEHEATLKGYALEGSDDFTEQGFEVWADSRKPHNAKPALNYKSQLGEKQTFAATGIAMKVTLTDLDPGTVYKYRTYAKFGEQTVYGSEMSFTTQGEWVAYKVTFVDKDGNTIAVREVEPGDDAVAPEAPEVEGYRFTGWDVDFTNVQSDLTVTAQYTEIVMVTLVVQAQDPAMGTVTGGGEYAQGIKVKITAVPNEGYVFVMWNDGNTDNPRTVTAADKTYIAVFEQQPQAIDQTQAAQSDNHKVIHNGQIYILRGDKTYTVTGQEMR